MRFTCAGNTDVGVVRTGNEDNFLVDHQLGVFIVADGMGGMPPAKSPATWRSG